MEKIVKPKTVYLLVYKCGRLSSQIFYTKKSAEKVAEFENKYYDNHLRVIKYNPEI